MPSEQKEMAVDKLFSSPWLHKQVETHLFLGPISRNIDICWFILAIPVINIFKFFMYADKSITNVLILMVALSFPLLFFWGMHQLTRFQQTAILWFSLKVTLGITCLFLMVLGPISSIQRGQTDALPLFLLGFIWFPLLEFMPKMASHQKYITVARLILTIPVVYVGIGTGYWHWGGHNRYFLL